MAKNSGREKQEHIDRMTKASLKAGLERAISGSLRMATAAGMERREMINVLLDNMLILGWRGDPGLKVLKGQ